MNRLKCFLAGFASAFDLTGAAFGRPYNSSGFNRDREAFARDREALAGDWRRVGDSLRKAMNIIDRETACGQRK